MARRRPWPLAAVAVTVALAAVACGGGATAARPPRAVPAEIVPPTLPDPGDPGHGFTVVEYDGARKQFGDAGAASLVDDGRLYEVRRGATLVGTLELATLRSKVDLSVDEDRIRMVRLIIAGASTTIKVDGVSVVRSSTADKTTFLWFGNGLFELLDVKGNGVDPLQMVKALVAFQKPTGRLRITSQTTRRNPLPPV